MAQSSSCAVLARQREARDREDAPQPSATAYRDEDFPGCVSFHLPASGMTRTRGFPHLPTLKLDRLPPSALHVVNDFSP